MNKKDAAIIDWVKNNRPDMLSFIEDVLKNWETNDRWYKAMNHLVGIVFEGGRHFQHENPNAELDNPNVYFE